MFNTDYLVLKPPDWHYIRKVSWSIIFIPFRSRVFEIARARQQQEFFIISKWSRGLGSNETKLTLKTRDFDLSENQVKLISKNPEFRFVFINWRLLNCWIRLKFCPLRYSCKQRCYIRRTDFSWCFYYKVLWILFIPLYPLKQGL